MDVVLKRDKDANVIFAQGNQPPQGSIGGRAFCRTFDSIESAMEWLRKNFPNAKITVDIESNT